MGENKTFIFLYPQPEVFHEELFRGALFNRVSISGNRQRFYDIKHKSAKTKKEKEKITGEIEEEFRSQFRPRYSEKLNECLDKRYREKH